VGPRAVTMSKGEWQHRLTCAAVCIFDTLTANHKKPAGLSETLWNLLPGNHVKPAGFIQQVELCPLGWPIDVAIAPCCRSGPAAYLFVNRHTCCSTMQLALRPNAACLGSAPAGSRQAVKGRKAVLVAPNAVKDVFMPALR
jgi:hypothetical protein